MRLTVTVLACALAAGGPSLAQSPPPASATPTIDALISLKRAASPAISPDARWVAYTIRETNWDENVYETEIWLADAQSGSTRQLTNGRKSSSAPAWSPDGKRLAFGSDREEDKRQIYLIDLGGGEAIKLTSAEESVGGFSWSPDGRSMAFTSNDPRPEALKEREKKYAEFDVIDQDHRLSHLYVVDVETKAIRRLTSGAFTVGRFEWSPDSRQIAFDHRINGDPANGGSADISVATVADGAVRKLVTQDGPDVNPQWSPDGSQIAFESSMASPKFFFSNRRIALMPAAGGAIANLSAGFDEDPSIVRWAQSGIFFTAAARTWAYLYRLDPATKAVTRLAPSERWIGSGFSLSADAQTVAFMASDASTFPEIYVAPVTAPAARARRAVAERERAVVAPREHQEMLPTKLTTTGDQVASWPSAPIEVIAWKSQDGATIEGILHKPVGFQPGTRYPLLVVIHGGPTGISRPTPYSSTAIYPIDLWVTKGALVLEPNYRGSAGYGEKFRSLNYRNLGVGDAWDVLSGIDYLVKEGLADAARVGTMGWSQGGYISAFLTTHDSARFQAVSVGAGISNWMTYYVNTDIHPFTRQYLNATPWDDPEIYARTSPMTYIKTAKAPTLIQHGATDQRVPLPNAYELYQGLQDVGVPTKLIVYRGFEGIGHGPSKPKSSRALMEHNLEWFDRYLWGSASGSQLPASR